MKEFKLIIAGSRSFNDYNNMEKVVNNLISNIKDTKDIIIISGTAGGADKLGEKYAVRNGYNLMLMPADWDLHKKRAGYIRNCEMAKIADACVVFIVGNSPGSTHMINIAKEKGIPLRVIKC